VAKRTSLKKPKMRSLSFAKLTAQDRSVLRRSTEKWDRAFTSDQEAVKEAERLTERDWTARIKTVA
jgi:hypothetical protein